MRILGSILAAAVLAAASSAQATTSFAEFSQTSSGSNVSWVKTGNTTGRLYSGIGANASNVAVKFSFLDPALLALSGLSANFYLDATASGAALVAGANLTQPNVQGLAQFIYSGPNKTIGAYNLVTGDNLLTVSFFSDAQIDGRAGTTSGALSVATPTGNIIYSSKFIDFTNSIDRDFAINLTSISNIQRIKGKNVNVGLTASAGKTLDSFRASAGGAFANENAIVPEPATWAMMIAGFGLAGAALRRRRALAA